jgi:hypothetical protein
MDSDFSIDPENEPSQESVYEQPLPPGYEDHENQSPAGMYGDQAEDDPIHAPRTSNYASVVPRLHGQESGLRATRPREEPATRNVRARAEHYEEPVQIRPEPKCDHEAFELFLELEGNSFKSSYNGRSLYVYDSSDGLWNLNGGHYILALCRKNSALLGKWGKNTRDMNYLKGQCMSVNKCEPDWLSRLDTCYKTGEMAFKDCIYNIVTGERRALSPAAMITFKLGYNAPHRPAHPMERQHVKRIISQVFPEDNLRKEVMKRYAETMFTVTNREKYCVQLFGYGENGKSTLFNITQKMFPAFTFALPRGALAVGNSQGGSGIMPWIVASFGKRMIYTDETPANAKVDGNLIKQFRGESEMSARLPFGDLRSGRPTGKIWFGSNDMVEFEPVDQQVLKSVHTFELPSTFCNDQAEIQRKRMGVNGNFIFPKDPELYKLFDRLDYKFAWIEECAEYLQMCTNDSGVYFESLNSKFDRRDIYLQSHPSTEDLLLAQIEVTGNILDRVRVRDLHTVLKTEGLQENKKKFLSWLISYTHTKYKGRVVHKKKDNIADVCGIRLRDTGAFTGGADLDLQF